MIRLWRSCLDTSGCRLQAHQMFCNRWNWLRDTNVGKILPCGHELSSAGPNSCNPRLLMTRTQNLLFFTLSQMSSPRTSTGKYSGSSRYLSICRNILMFFILCFAFQISISAGVGGGGRNGTRLTPYLVP